MPASSAELLAVKNFGATLIDGAGVPLNILH